MKKVHIFLAVAFTLVSGVAMAQQDFSGPQYAKWGDTPEERQENIMASNFLAESAKNNNYSEAVIHLNQLVTNRPQASVNTFKYGKNIYRAKISRAQSREEKNSLVDSLLLMYDLQAQYFGDNVKEGRGNILGNKAKEILLYRSGERQMIREAFKAAIAADGEAADGEIVALYFKNLCDDYQNGDVHPDEVIAEYERLEPIFEGRPEEAESKARFNSSFGQSGVASCENLERIFGAKLAANPNDEVALKQAVALMSRAKCTSAFYLHTAEKYYEVKPSAETAMALAQIFQDANDYDKAVKYLTEALNKESNVAEKEKLLVRIGIVHMVAGRIPAAASSVRQALELNPENGLAYFVLAQSYAMSTSGCSGLAAQAAFWAAYDTMSRAINYMTEDDEAAYGQAARASLSAYRSRFPSSEECFFNELKDGDRYTVTCGTASGVATTVRYR